MKSPLGFVSVFKLSFGCIGSSRKVKKKKKKIPLKEELFVKCVGSGLFKELAFQRTDSEESECRLGRPLASRPSVWALCVRDGWLVSKGLYTCNSLCPFI